MDCEIVDFVGIWPNVILDLLQIAENQPYVTILHLCPLLLISPSSLEMIRFPHSNGQTQNSMPNHFCLIAYPPTIKTLAVDYLLNPRDLK